MNEQIPPTKFETSAKKHIAPTERKQLTPLVSAREFLEVNRGARQLTEVYAEVTDAIECDDYYKALKALIAAMIRRSGNSSNIFCSTQARSAMKTVNG